MAEHTPYERTTWKTGDVVTSGGLNNIENELVYLDGKGAIFKAVYGSTTFSDINKAIDRGEHVICETGNKLYSVSNRDSSNIKFANVQGNTLSTLNVTSANAWSTSSSNFIIYPGNIASSQIVTYNGSGGWNATNQNSHNHTKSQITDFPSLATVATSGSYNDLSNKPSLATVATSGNYNDLSNKPGLATVATSGSYNDLSNKPTIPTVNNATLTIQKNGSNVATFTANSASNATANITVPTKVSELSNDSSFISKGFYAGTSAPSNTNLLWIDTTAVTGGLKYHNGSSWVAVPVRFN